MYENIKTIRPHFHSLREVQENVSLDIKLPLTWNYEQIMKPYRSVSVKVQDKNEKYTLLSLISLATQEGYDVVFACAIEIIKHNKEEEEKRSLFEQKVNELKMLFQKESLDKLKEINFLEVYEQEVNTGFGMVREGDEEGRSRSEQDEETDD